MDEDGNLIISMECAKYPFALVRSTWNYQENELQFREWLEKVRLTLGVALLRSIRRLDGQYGLQAIEST